MSFDEILAAKEARLNQVARLWSEGTPWVITLGVNLPGGAASYPFADDLLTAAWLSVSRAFCGSGLVLQLPYRVFDAAGPFAIAVPQRKETVQKPYEASTALRIKPNAEPGGGANSVTDTGGNIGARSDIREIKEMLVRIEERHPLGRLFDLDLLVPGIGPVSRTHLGLSPRQCLVCQEVAHVCRKRGTHTVEELRKAVLDLLDRYDPRAFALFAGDGIRVNALSAEIGEKAVAGMLLEAAAWPSPGLVSPVGSGGHTDMDYHTFLMSSSAISAGFSVLAACGLEGRRDGIDLRALASRVRSCGYVFEEEMFRVTRGVNTHKGLLFTLGLVTASAGYLVAPDTYALYPGALKPEDIACTVSRLASSLVQRELGSPGPASARARRLYEASGLTGPRGEAARGLPTVLSVGLPALKEALDQGYGVNDGLVHTLVSLIAVVEDTAIAGRHGVETLREKVWPAARNALSAGSIFTSKGRELILKMQEDFDRERINPGGSADLTAVSCSLYLLEQGGFPREALDQVSVFHS